MKTADCKDRERALREQDPEWVEALERHAEECAICAQELRLWNTISVAARGMGRNWESPGLWPRIERALTAEREAGRRPRPWSLLGNLTIPSRHWQATAALVAALALSLWGASRVLRHPARSVSPEVERRLLTEQALHEIEKSEATYVASIQKLSALAVPKIESPKTPLLESYREKLLLLDEAIADCRAQIARNRANPELREELLSIYREKQRTLELLIREE